MKKQLHALYRLLKINETVYLVITTTLLGTAAAGGIFGGHLILVLLANWLAVGFTTIMNAIEDAPDDALSGQHQQNPIAAGFLTPQTAKILSGTTAALSALAFSLLGPLPFFLGLMTLFLGFLYTYQGFRLKNMAVVDLLSHSLLMAGMQFLCGYFTFTQQFRPNWFWPFIFVVAISSYTKLHQEVNQHENHQAITLQNTVALLGIKNSQILMFISLIIGIFTGAVSFLFINIVPHWGFFVMTGLFLILLIPPLWRFRREKETSLLRNALHKALEQSAALALLLQYVLPWLNEWINHTPI